MGSCFWPSRPIPRARSGAHILGPPSSCEDRLAFAFCMQQSLRACDLSQNFLCTYCHLVLHCFVYVFVLRFWLLSLTNGVCKFFTVCTHIWMLSNAPAPKRGWGFPDNPLVVVMCHWGFHFVGVSSWSLPFEHHQVEKAPFLKPPRSQKGQLSEFDFSWAKEFNTSWVAISGGLTLRRQKWLQKWLALGMPETLCEEVCSKNFNKISGKCK